MIFRCGVCAATQAIEIVSYPRYPLCLVPLPPEIASQVERYPLTLVACTRCGHMQVPDVNRSAQKLLYDLYYSYYQVDTMESMLPAYRDPFHRMILSLAGEGRLKKGRLLEIGCSSGAMIDFLRQFCVSYTGIDPSSRIADARSSHPEGTFVQDYFPSADLSGPFEIVVSQFTLEHIELVGEFVRAVRRHCEDGSTFLVQVPDAGYYLRTRQPNFLAHEHVHYFRRAQLDQLLRLTGFEPIEWAAEGPSLICAARATEPLEAERVEHPLSEADELRQRLTRVPDLPRNAILYGVGLTLHWILLMRPELADGAVVVDDNPGYENFGVPGYDLRISLASAELFQSGRDVVLTLNEIYHDRILDRLKAWGACGRIFRIAEGEWVSTTITSGN